MRMAGQQSGRDFPDFQSRSAAGDRNPWLIAVVVSLATFMLVLDTSIANVALRHIAGSLAAGIDESKKVITTYLVANAVILPVSGWLAGIIGRKRFYMLCVAVFTAASLLCGLATSLPMLIVFRILQGLGGGGMAPSEQAILADTFPPEKRAQAFALTALCLSCWFSGCWSSRQRSSANAGSGCGAESISITSALRWLRCGWAPWRLCSTKASGRTGFTPALS
jgi:MFS family permease